MSTNKTVKITWTDGTTVVFNDIPADVPDAAAKDALEKKHKKKIYKYEVEKSAASAPAAGAPAQGGAKPPSSQSDRDSSSGTAPPADKDTTPPTLSTLPSGQRDDLTDYRDKFPDKFTPKNMRRNKWGELIYE